MKIAIIQWTDSALHGTENYRADDETLKPVRAVSVGIIVKNEKDYVTLAVDQWETGNFRNVETILRRQIDYMEIKEIKIGKKK